MGIKKSVYVAWHPRIPPPLPKNRNADTTENCTIPQLRRRGIKTTEVCDEFYGRQDFSMNFTSVMGFTDRRLHTGDRSLR